MELSGRLDEMSEWRLMCDLVAVWVSYTHTGTHLLCTHTLTHMCIISLLLVCTDAEHYLQPVSTLLPSVTSYSTDEAVHPPSFFVSMLRSDFPPSFHPSLLPGPSIIHKLEARPYGSRCEWVLWAMMTVIAEEMEVTGISNYSWCEGLKGSYVK